MQYAVVVFEDFTLVATVAGPFRSKQRAIEACERINDVSAWTEERPEAATAVAQVVLLESANDIAARLTEPDVEIRRGGR